MFTFTSDPSPPVPYINAPILSVRAKNYLNPVTIFQNFTVKIEHDRWTTTESIPLMHATFPMDSVINAEESWSVLTKQQPLRISERLWIQ